MRHSVLSVFLALALLLQTSSSRTVLATVSDAKNRSVVDVGVDDFVVREAGQARDVLDARVADYPIVLLVDTSATAHEFEAIRKAAARFIARVGQRPLALGAMSEPPAMLTTFEDGRPAISEKLQRLTASPSAGSFALQSVAEAAEAIRAIGARFSAIVVISANAADPNRIPPGEWLTTILDSGAMVQVVAERPFFNRGPGGAAQSDILHTLADQTRGQFTTIYSNDSYQVALDHLSDRLAAEMMIEYVVPAGATPTADVKLGVRLPGLRVRGLGVR
jgi:hypothetical protein